jgi:aspartate-semialdehyde dehydrogenase
MTGMIAHAAPWQQQPCPLMFGAFRVPLQVCVLECVHVSIAQQVTAAQVIDDSTPGLCKGNLMTALRGQLQQQQQTHPCNGTSLFE